MVIFLDKHSLIDDSQHGFRKSRSLIFLSFWRMSLPGLFMMINITVDAVVAFDKVTVA